MSVLDRFVGKTLKGFLIVAGLATCLPLLLAASVELGNRQLFAGLLDYGPSSVPALRHWGIMVFGIGVLMIAAAFRPWLRFETMLFVIIEKSFMVYLYLTSRGEPWSQAYQGGAMVDGTIVLCSLLYFMSRHGRPLPAGRA